jgi:hypothetical protein
MENRQKASGAANFLNIFDTLNFQDFSKHIRSEPCGTCTEFIAKKAEGFEEEDEYQYILNSFGEGKSLFQLPKVTQKLLTLAINQLDGMALDGRYDEAQQYHNIIIKIINKIHVAAKKEAMEIKGKKKGYYSFYRKIYPVLAQKSQYLGVVEENEKYFDSNHVKNLFTEIESTQKKVERKIKNLEIPFTSYASFKNGKKEMETGRRKRRIWGSGFEMSDMNFQNLEEIHFGIISFNFEHFLVFSSHKIDPQVEYEANVRVNCVDLSFNMILKLDDSTTKALIEGIDQKRKEQKELSEILNELRLHYKTNDISLYILEKKEIEKEQKMYFKSICLEQIELERNLGAKFYKEAFCN